jgi:hypothetical protein
MKRLTKIQINAQRLLSDNELITIKGGYDHVWVSCRLDGQQICGWPVATCEGEEPGSAKWFCDTYCSNYDSLICAG